MSNRKSLRVKLDLTMKEAGTLHEVLAIIESGDIKDIRRRNIKIGCIFNKLNKAEEIALETG